MPTIRCWNCNAENDPVATAGFCDRCGRKLDDIPEAAIVDAPRRRSETPDIRRYDRDDGRRLPYVDPQGSSSSAAELQRLVKQSSGVLFGVAGLQFFCGLIGLVALPHVLGFNAEPLLMVIAVLIIVGIAGAFVGLGVWARYQPLPPAIIGLVLYLIVFVSNIVLSPDPEMVTKGIWLPILMFVMLVQGIVAASKYNKLKQQLDFDDY